LLYVPKWELRKFFRSLTAASARFRGADRFAERDDGVAAINHVDSRVMSLTFKYPQFTMRQG